MPTHAPRILVGFDGSDDSVAALHFAIAEAQGRSGVLHLVHVIDDSVLNSAWGIVFNADSFEREAASALAQARDVALAAGVPSDRLETAVVTGHPASALTKLAEHASLLVVGRRAQSGTESMFVGSTAVGVATNAPCAIVVVSDLGSDKAPTGLVSVAIDSSQVDSPALVWGLHRAARLGARLDVVTVVGQPTGRLFGPTHVTQAQLEAASAEAHRRLTAILATRRDAFPSVDAHVHVRGGTITDELIAVSRASDMLIVGVHPGFPTYSIGGKVRALMAHAHCPLGIVRHR